MHLLKTAVTVALFGVVFSGCSILKGKPAGFQVISNIPAKVSIDSKEVGATPYETTSLDAQKHTVLITPQDVSYQSHTAALKLYSGYIAQLDWNFAKTEQESSGVTFEYDSARVKEKAELQLVASPDNVPVNVDGKNVGFTPLLLQDLSEGNHTVSFQAPGYNDLDRTVKLVKGTRIMMTVKLSKQPIESPSPTPVASESAELSSSPSAKATPSAAPKATQTPDAVIKKSSDAKPYVEILSTPTEFLRVRKSATTTADEVAKLSVGSTVPYANASASGWFKIKYDGEKTGWISSQYAKLVE